MVRVRVKNTVRVGMVFRVNLWGFSINTVKGKS